MVHIANNNFTGNQEFRTDKGVDRLHSVYLPINTNQKLNQITAQLIIDNIAEDTTSVGCCATKGTFAQYTRRADATCVRVCERERE